MTTRGRCQLCLCRNADWRREAQHLRLLSTQRHLTASQREILLREAIAAQACADEWLRRQSSFHPSSGVTNHEPL
jgi:hypothetical protein